MSYSWSTIPIQPSDYLKNYFGFRYWDGYDRPNYGTIFEITKKERDLKSDRFKNFNHINFNECGTFYGISISSKNIEEMFYWIFENINSKWYCDLEDIFDNLYFMNFWFEDDTNALAFKLRWL